MTNGGSRVALARASRLENQRKERLLRNQSCRKMLNDLLALAHQLTVHPRAGISEERLGELREAFNKNLGSNKRERAQKQRRWVSAWAELNEMEQFLQYASLEQHIIQAFEESDEDDDDEAASGSDVEGDEEEEDGEGESSDGVADGDEDADEEMTEVTEKMEEVDLGV